eukprot:TRINITY_DN17388_c0_g1_i1.p1 TRINITY_DN17388_c0_g1~~TRINITY_DN17388_c0_g1_i1.p1  ORF type:complete len:139 (-),score=25.50 TRINITY_DN17388_c0_g1_i1:79-447(-)
MADEEGVEVDVELLKKKKERPVRRIKVQEKDTAPASTDEIIEYAQQVLDEMEPGYTHKDVSQKLKLRLDKEKSGTWHVIIGSHFGGNVTNDYSTLMNFQIDNIWFLLFRSGPPEKAAHGEHK